MHSGTRTYSNERGGAAAHGLVIGGQSNAVGWEPVDASVEVNEGRVNLWNLEELTLPGVLRTATEPAGGVGHSAMLRLANHVALARNRDVLISDMALGNTNLRLDGGTGATDWGYYPATFATTLLGKLVTQALKFPNLKCVLWFGHESAATDTYITTWQADWAAHVARLRSLLGKPALPVIFGQLCRQGNSPAENVATVVSRLQEEQRQTEAGQANGVAGTYLVPSWDVALYDYIHMNGAGQRVLGSRFARMVRKVVYGESSLNTGPRLSSVTLPSGSPSTITVQCSAALAAPTANYNDQFRVYNNGTELASTIVAARSASTTAVELTRGDASNFPTGGTLLVTYGGKPTAGLSALTDAVKDTADSLPLPAFRVTVTQT